MGDKQLTGLIRDKGATGGPGRTPKIPAQLPHCDVREKEILKFSMLVC